MLFAATKDEISIRYVAKPAAGLLMRLTASS
jgi:hypothetical protein